MTCGRGGPAGSRRLAGAGAVATDCDGVPEPKAVRSRVIRAAIEAAASPAMRRALLLADARACSVRRACPGARGGGMRGTLTEAGTSCKEAVERRAGDTGRGDWGWAATAACPRRGPVEGVGGNREVPPASTSAC